MDELAKILLAILGAGLFIALINGGWTGPGGVTDWMKAKFLGQPTQPPLPTPAVQRKQIHSQGYVADTGTYTGPQPKAVH